MFALPISVISYERRLDLQKKTCWTILRMNGNLNLWLKFCLKNNKYQSV